MLDLDQFCALVDSLGPSWREVGIESMLYRSPDDGRNKHAAWVAVSTEKNEGELIVWDSGEGELQFEVPDGVACKHYDDLLTADLIAPVLKQLARAVQEGGGLVVATETGALVHYSRTGHRVTPRFNRPLNWVTWFRGCG